ncbi:sigma-70 family RNA polymerase sigma factor [Nocardia sp. CA2R105]|uniref:sigma-70 family RNA polymerase sigma factor n=1 Tax=Nocardia coffeae TaxID=2873381 RepID=UPI001CA7100D|nr:sigma-70 family RNA polymerase sigma factor [Nocardia coffeae]MBY8862254.1 sigma-70 family RNA polymerase sigma factor [Nocardia coffeae]
MSATDTTVSGLHDRTQRLDEVEQHYHHTLRRFACRLVGDHGRADEIVQDALIRLWQRPAMLNGPVTDLRAWLFTVTRNLAYDELRCARRRHEFATETHTLLDRPAQDPCENLADTWVIQQALATLGHEHREVIVHAYYRRATIKTIAIELAIPPGTVKSRLHYALHALRDACKAQGITAPTD